MKKLAKRKANERPEIRPADGRFRKGHSIGKAYRFKPGTRPNPGGRPKIKVVSEAARALLASVVPGDRYGRTFAERIALEAELKNLTRVVADGVDSPAIRAAIVEREKELSAIT